MLAVRPDTVVNSQSEKPFVTPETPEARLPDERVYKFDSFLLLIFSALFIVVFLQFFTRYVLNNSIAWTEEAARYLLILLAFSGSIRCQLNNSHISLSFMNKFYGRWHSVIHILSLMLSVFILSILTWSAFALIKLTKYQHMISLPFPKYYLYVGVTLMLLINILVCLWQVMIVLRKVIR